MTSDPARSRAKRPPKPLDAPSLEALALRYVERYATTQAKLARYLERKLVERGWAGDRPAAVEGLVGRFAALRYVDDRAFAEARAASLVRRGFGERRVSLALREAGVGAEDRAAAGRVDPAAGLAAALALARRRRIGPFASVAPDRQGRERAIAILIRAGHDFATARRIASAAPGDDPEQI